MVELGWGALGSTRAPLHRGWWGEARTAGAAALGTPGGFCAVRQAGRKPPSTDLCLPPSWTRPVGEELDTVPEHTHTPFLRPLGPKGQTQGKENSLRCEEKGRTEDGMVGWHHRPDGPDFE